ncbi:MAG: hypothetical protein JSS27_17785 [Planctomycetes bacterium]|nr:hypothetical protein [Planctomycetota bacterium]
MLQEPRQPSASSRGERRADRRLSYPQPSCLRTLSADPAAPTQATWVRCHDLGPRGISFWASEAPAGEHVLLQIEASETEQLVAEVRHATPVTCSREPMFLIGCQVIGTQAI